MPVPMLNGPITHLVSDCDGVLIDSEAAALQALLSALQLRVGDRDELNALILPRLGLSIDVLLLQIFEKIGIADPDPAEIAGIIDLVEMECDRQLALVPGVLQALRDIRLPMAVASNSSHARVRSALQQTGLAALFGERIYTADVVGHPKPHPAVYLAAAASFGVAPGNCIAIEDSVTGATAAVAAGMCVLGFTGGAHVAAGQATRLRATGVHATFDDMRQLPRLIQRC
jgi:HAD superfamily hydrolase (TIGR01509 family)